jgi:hypothetical protein
MDDMIAQGLVNLGFEPMVDFIVQNDGDGPTLREWLSAKMKPSEEEIAAAALREPVPFLVTPAQAKIAKPSGGRMRCSSTAATHTFRHSATNSI